MRPTSLEIVLNLLEFFKKFPAANWTRKLPAANWTRNKFWNFEMKYQRIWDEISKNKTLSDLPREAGGKDPIWISENNLNFELQKFKFGFNTPVWISEARNLKFKISIDGPSIDGQLMI